MNAYVYVNGFLNYVLIKRLNNANKVSTALGGEG